MPHHICISDIKVFILRSVLLAPWFADVVKENVQEVSMHFDTFESVYTSI